MYWLLLLLGSLFRESAEACNICAWPNVGTANQRGQCVIGLGLQSSLDASCSIYCQDWGNRVAGQTFSYHVATKPSESESGTNCLCKRVSLAGSIEFLARPQKACTNVGPSDDIINSWKRSDSTFSQTIKNNTNLIEGKIFETYNLGNGEVSGRMNFTYYDGSTHQTMNSTALIELGDIATGRDAFSIWSAVQRSAVELAKHIDSCFNMQNRTLSKLGDTLSTVLSYSRNGVTGNQLADAVADLRYSINSRSGGGGSSTPTDLTPVLDGLQSVSGDIASARAAQIEAIGAVGDSVSSLGDQLGGMGRAIDSGASARWRRDNQYRDSVNKVLSDHYEAANGTKDGANAAIGQMQGAGTDIGFALSGWRGSTCDDVPIIQIPYLDGKSIDVTDIFDGMGGTVMAVVRVIELAGGLAAGAFFGLRVILKES